MSQPPTGNLPPDDDTPVDERAPYGDPSRAWLVILVAVLAVVAVAAGLVARAAWRSWRRRRRPSGRGEVFIMVDPTVPAAGTLYRVEFLDDTYPQLTDRRLDVVLDDAHGPAADAALDALGRRLAGEVEARDSQRCFRPVVELYDAADRLVRRRAVAA